MKQLILFRHAKSDWSKSTPDRKRDILKKGEIRTQKSALELKKQIDFVPDKWISSPAKRAYKTAEIAKSYFSLTKEIKISEKLYTFSYFDLLNCVKTIKDKYDSVIIFGHNEAFTEFVNRMGSKNISNLPTSGVALIEFEEEKWSEITKGVTKIIIIPKNLM